jgi:hypothetical protein
MPSSYIDENEFIKNSVLDKLEKIGKVSESIKNENYDSSGIMKEQQAQEQEEEQEQEQENEQNKELVINKIYTGKSENIFNKHTIYNQYYKHYSSIIGDEPLFVSKPSFVMGGWTFFISEFIFTVLEKYARQNEHYTVMDSIYFLYNKTQPKKLKIIAFHELITFMYHLVRDNANNRSNIIIINNCCQVVYGDSQIGSEPNIVNTIPPIVKLLMFQMNYSKLDHYNIITTAGKWEETIQMPTGIHSVWNKAGVSNSNKLKAILEFFFFRDYDFDINYTNAEPWRIYNEINKMKDKVDNKVFVDTVLSYSAMAKTKMDIGASAVTNTINAAEKNMWVFDNSILNRFALTNNYAQSRVTLYESNNIAEDKFVEILTSDPNPRIAYKALLDANKDKYEGLHKQFVNIKIYKSHLDYSVRQIGSMRNWDIAFKLNNNLQVVVLVGRSPTSVSANNSERNARGRAPSRPTEPEKPKGWFSGGHNTRKNKDKRVKTRVLRRKSTHS